MELVCLFTQPFENNALIWAQYVIRSLTGCISLEEAGGLTDFQITFLFSPLFFVIFIKRLVLFETTDQVDDANNLV